MSTLFKGVQYSRGYTIIYLNFFMSIKQLLTNYFLVLNKIHIMVILVTKDYLSTLKNWWVSLGGYKRWLIKGNNNVGFGTFMSLTWIVCSSNFLFAHIIQIKALRIPNIQHYDSLLSITFCNHQVKPTNFSKKRGILW